MIFSRRREGHTLLLDGNSLNAKKVSDFVAQSDAKVAITPEALKRVRESNAFLKEEMGKNVIYGITTGFGPMASHIIGKGQLKELQYNLIRSHATGAGKPAPQDFVLAAMLDRLNSLLKGYSGVSETLVENVSSLINKRIIPVVPRHGAVGTSGDLVQLAHIALALIGEGEVFYDGKRMEARAALRKAKI